MGQQQKDQRIGSGQYLANLNLLFKNKSAYDIETCIYTLLLIVTITLTNKQLMISCFNENSKINVDQSGGQKPLLSDNKDQTLYKSEMIQDNKMIYIQNVDDDAFDEQMLKKKNQNKQKYRRLKQKLTAMCYQHQQKCLIKQTKEVSSPNKSRLLTLAIEFEKMTLNQTKDYAGLEAKLTKIMKILDHKRQHDLLILKHSRFVPAFSLLLKKVPAFHKNQFIQSVKTVELGLKLLRIFCTVSSNRDYMISTNQLVILNSCLSSFYGKQQKKLALQCIGVLHELLASRIKADSQQIVSVTLQIVFFGQLARKIRLGIQSCIGEDNTVTEQEFILKSLKYLYLLYKKYFERFIDKPIYQQPETPQFMQQNSDAILSFIQTFLAALLLEKDGQRKDQELPICIINISLYAMKLLNINTHVNVKTAQKVFDICSKSQFTDALKYLFQYVKTSIQQGEQIHQITCICSQIILFLGKISCNNSQIKVNIRQSYLLDSLCNHPLIYLMDEKLKSILIPSLCSIMDDNEDNIKKFLSESSCDNIVNFIKMQTKIQQSLQMTKLQQQQSQHCSDIQSILSQTPQIVEKPCDNTNTSKTLTRKSSVSSMNSFTTQCTQNSNNCYYMQNEEQRSNYRLLSLLPFQKWDKLAGQLVRLDQ